MIENLIKNICLIGFALIGPIYLPAGGIQRYLSEYSLFDDSQEIVLNSNCSIYCFPDNDSSQLRLIKAGSSLTILNKWVDSDRERWLRVKLLTNSLLESSNKPIRGWIKL